MNIFYTSSCPVECARALDDKRVIKMCLETAQMLCTALAHYGIASPYKPTHQNHPCTIWARSSRANFQWLLDHGLALCLEYTARYGRRHKCQDILEDLTRMARFIPDRPATTPPNCARNKSLGIDYTNIRDISTAYITYLSSRWEHDKREPTWYGKP